MLSAAHIAVKRQVPPRAVSPRLPATREHTRNMPLSRLWQHLRVCEDAGCLYNAHGEGEKWGKSGRRDCTKRHLMPSIAGVALNSVRWSRAWSHHHMHK
jgi:hypothetical protein